MNEEQKLQVETVLNNIMSQNSGREFQLRHLLKIPNFRRTNWQRRQIKVLKERIGR